jgi:parvulin-like peptidyl-prolyl isomerase
MTMKTVFCAALLVVLGTGTAGAQLVSSHNSGNTTPTAAPLPAIANPHKSSNMASPKMAPAMQVTGKPVARVNGVELSDRDLLSEMYTIFPYAQQHSGFPKELEPELRQGALQMLIFDELVYQEARRRNVTIPPADLAAAEKAFRKQFPTQAAYQEMLKVEANGSEAVMRDKIRRSLMIEKFLNQEVNGPARINTAQAKAQYDKNVAQYKHGEIVRIQSISFLPPNKSKSVQEEAKRHAEEGLKQAKATKSYREFGLLAENISEDDFHVKMGDHKSTELSTLPPPVQQALAKMKPGDVSDLIVFDGNYTIIRLESRTLAGTTPFSEVKPKLQSDMQREKTEQLRSALAQKLGQNAKIEKL